MTQEQTEHYDLGNEVKFYIMNVGSASDQEILLALRKYSALDQATYEKVIHAILEAHVEIGNLSQTGNFYHYK